MKNWKVSTKLIAVLIPPLLVLVILAGFGIQERRTDAASANRAEDLTELAAFSSNLAHALQNEAVFSAAHMSSGGSAVSAELAEQRALTDERLAEVNAVLADFDVSGESGDFQAAVGDARDRMDQIDTFRPAVDNRQTSVQESIAALNKTADALIEVNTQIGQASKTPELSDPLATYAAFSSGKQASAEMLATMVAISNRVGPDGTPLPFFVDSAGAPCDIGEAEAVEDCAEWTDYQLAVAQGTIHDQLFQERATKDQKQLVRNETSSEEVRVANSMLDDLEVAAVDSEPFPVSEAPLLAVQAAQNELAALHSVEGALVAEVVDDAVARSNTASSEMRLFIVVAVAAILASIALALLVARAIVGPLQRLTVGANKLSTEQLPSLVDQLKNPDDEMSTWGLGAQVEAIEIDSKDEIGQLAEAFNTIQQVTVDVAEEQAALLRKGIGDIFINLARRNQTLLDRQIEFIDQLEANEEDPDQLDNLFKLDHLATRMRRNAESLLVLAGAEPPRRRGRPVALADVIRVAIGEVEDFARISLVALDAAQVGGNVAVDLAHLLSELMENATHFSPPDTHVEVTGRIESNGTYTIMVEDQGIGMSQEQLVEANEQLSEPPLVGLSLSRSLGFIVIGRLARRFHVGVELVASPGGGISARVSLPVDAVTDIEGQPLPIEGGAVAELTESLIDTDVDADDDVVVVEEIVEEDLLDGDEVGTVMAVEDDSVVVEELVVEEDDVEDVEEDDVEEDDEEAVEELVGENDDLVARDGEPEPSTFEAAVPEGDAFDRGLESLLDEETQDTEPPVDGAVVEADEQTHGDTVGKPFEEPVGVAEVQALDDRPPASPPPAGASITAAGLVRRTPKKRSESVTGGGSLRTAATTQRPTGQTTRSPEEVRKMLSRYRGGLKRGRDDADSPEAAE